MNLPMVIDMTDGRKIKYIYDAAGIKLQERVYADGTTEPVSVTDYIGERIYESSSATPRTIQMIHHEEGRIMPGPDPGTIAGTMEVPTWEYQYYLKDHLGNTRVTYGIPTVNQYLATMEIDVMENRIIENQEFENIIQSEDNSIPSLNRTPTKEDIPNPEYVAKLDGVSRVTGPAKSLKVLPGDVVDIEVYVKYLHKAVYDETVPVSMLLGGFFGAFLSAGSEMLISNGFVSEAILSSLPVIQNPNKNYDDVPSAFVNVLLFNKDYDLELGAKYAISNDGKFELGDNDFGPHEYLKIDPITIQKEGYIYIYLSNESKMRDVYFDDLLITHTHSPIVQKNDYYPFGLGIAGLSAQKENSYCTRWTFQGQERQDAHNLGWYGFKWRNHQPELGRFFNIDPLSEKYAYNSTFAFSENRVVDGIELEGLEYIFYLHSPYLSGKFHEAVSRGDVYEQRRITSWAMNNQFSDDYVNSRVFLDSEKPLNNMVGRLVHDQNIFGVKVITYGYSNSGNIRQDQSAYLFHPSNGIYKDKGYPVDVKSNEYYTDEFGKSVDFIGSIDFASISNNGSGNFDGYIRGMGFVHGSVDIFNDGKIAADFQTAFRSPVFGNFYKTDYLNKGITNFFVNEYASTNNGSTFQNNYWKLRTIGGGLGLPSPNLRNWLGTLPFIENYFGTEYYMSFWTRGITQNYSFIPNK